MAKVFILLPAYNEEESLKSLIGKFQSIQANHEIVVVDDGSEDATSKLCEEFSLKCITHEKNMGLGEAVKTGMNYVLKNASDDDFLVIMGADDTHNPSLINEMIEKIGFSDVVIASRFVSSGCEIGVSRLRQMLSRVAGKMFTVLFKISGVTDYTSGYRMYRLTILRNYVSYTGELPASEKGFTVMAEILIKLASFGASFIEVPLTLRYNLKKGPSKIKTIRTILRYFYLFIKLKIRVKKIKSISPIKKILHIINIPWYSGLAGYAIDMGRYMNPAPMHKCGGKERVVFAVVGDSPLYDKIKNKFEVIALPGRNVVKTLLGLFKILMLPYNIKMIFAHTGSSFFIGIVTGFLRGIPVYRVRAESSRVRKNIFNILMHKLAKGVIVPNEFIKNDFLNFGVSENKIFLLPPVVDTDKFCYSPLPENMTITLLGRLDEVKGHKVLIESLPLIREKVKNIKVVFSGKEEGIKWRKLKEYARELNVEDMIEYIGYAPDDEIVKIMQNSRAGIIPSLGSEAVSRVALEWMSCGRPVVASNVGCLNEIVKEGRYGFIVQPDNPHLLAKAVIEILKDSKLSTKISINAHEFVESNFSQEIYKKSLNLLWQRK